MPGLARLLRTGHLAGAPPHAGVPRELGQQLFVLPQPVRQQACRSSARLSRVPKQGHMIDARTCQKGAKTGSHD